ncbi:hypothetical protein [Anaeromyxobacter dehalogenans]|uniref:Uncharacterized protein n=1 Tax=Anaeromyxobacter dehalogenans (strain 2CP-C) TaxID=290397 RepID=Q2IPT1_ANADE|nr:hypothetical protein [Anaeromyxobacter dehalogenans]ABC80812.1 hypothetical protein Adeh_1037 [Anaeromyxobacter dehalogenans 2CP-C]
MAGRPCALSLSGAGDRAWLSGQQHSLRASAAGIAGEHPQHRLQAADPPRALLRHRVRDPSGAAVLVAGSLHVGPILSSNGASTGAAPLAPASALAARTHPLTVLVVLVVWDSGGRKAQITIAEADAATGYARENVAACESKIAKLTAEAAAAVEIVERIEVLPEVSTAEVVEAENARRAARRLSAERAEVENALVSLRARLEAAERTGHAARMHAAAAEVTGAPRPRA